MIFPWDCEFHKCKTCFSISFVEDLSDSRVENTYMSSTVTREQLHCSSMSDVIAEHQIKYLNVPTLREILEIASEFPDYEK